MKRSATVSCLLAASMVLVGSSALAQEKVAGPKAGPPLKTMMLENEKKLNEMESLLNKLDTAEVVLEEDVKNLEKALLEYVDGMDKAMAAAQDTSKKEVMAKERKMFEDMTRAFEVRLRRIDTLHTAITDKILNATIKLDEAWLNKMIKEQKEGYYRSLYPEGRQKVQTVHPALEGVP